MKTSLARLLASFFWFGDFGSGFGINSVVVGAVATAAVVELVMAMVSAMAAMTTSAVECTTIN
jgi:hypothetical protein